MSTPNSPVFVKYRGGNNAVDFSVPFPYFDRSYVKLIYKALNSDEVELVVNTDYTWKDDHTVTLNEPLGEYDVLVIVRRTDLGSPAEFDNQRRLFPVAAMDNDDLSFHQIQEMQEQLDRCYKEKITSDNDASDVESIINHYVNEAELIKQDCMANADLAREWAIKMDGTIDGFNYSSKYYAMQIMPIKDDITTVASISSDVTTVASNATDISAVAADLTNIDNASTNAQIARTSAETAEFYAKNVKFGMIKELFSINDWTQENNLYYIEYDYNIISAVYKLNQTNYELVTNIDIKDLGNKVRIYSIDRFAGFVLLVNTAEEQSITWGNIGGTLSNQTDLQNALNTKANTSDIPTTTNDLFNDSGFITSSALNGYATQNWVNQQGFITGITSNDVTTALGFTPYNSSNPNGYITSSALAPYVLSSSLATVATSGDYDDLINKPSEVTETTVSNWGFTKNTGTVTSVNNVSPVNGNVTLSIPTVNNASLIIQKNGTNVATFTANASSNVTANISVPNTVSSVSSSSTNNDAVGAKLFYDTCGDIETLINAL